MRLALKLASKAKGRTHPNPMVGAVIVKEGHIVGQGFHRRAGSPHAEIEALRQAGESARGATLYVNLEPCDHLGRTGPCSHALIKAGIKRVVVGMQDPNPLVNGKGLQTLRQAGMDITVDVLKEACYRLNEAFTCFITQKRPWVTYKAAMTLDGRVATRTRHSRWVTGEKARSEGHRLRNINDAIIVGIGTILADDPELNCRGIKNGRDPIRIVIDSHLKTPVSAKIVALSRHSVAPTWIFTTPDSSPRQALALELAGAEIIRVPASPEARVSIMDMLKILAKREITSCLLEGGPTLAGSFWREGLIDRLVAIIAPKVLADPQGLPMIAGAEVREMSQATELHDVQFKRLGRDLLITGKPCLRV